MKKIKLYDYQQAMLENIIKVLTTAAMGRFYDENGKKIKMGSSVMVQMPTGTGKTYVMAAVVKWFLDNYDEGEVWIIAHRRELVEQMQQTLDRFCLTYGEKETVLKAKVRIRVLSIQWLTRHIVELETAGCVPGLIVVDEAHHVIAVNDEMISVKRANTARKKMNAQQLKEYLEGVTRFQEGKRWGLRVKDDIIVRPIYSEISDFEGDYAVCAIGRPLYLRYGILDRRGNIILPMEYESVYLIGGHRASVTKVHGFPRDIEL